LAAWLFAAVPPVLAGLTDFECLTPEVLVVDVVADEAAVDVAVEVLEADVVGVTLEVVVSELTPADWVAVEPPPQALSTVAATIAARQQARREAIRFVGIDRSAYRGGQLK
jgi:hypothetical protein